MTELLGLPYSPWTEKARFALDVRRVEYRFRHYQPLLGEPALRMKLGQWSGTVSVPVLTDDDGRVIAGSAAIARWADERGDGPQLFPSAHARRIEELDAAADDAMNAARGLVLRRVLADGDALLEMVPKPMAAMSRPLARAVARFGVQRTMRKYGVAKQQEDDAMHVVERVLGEFRELLGSSAGRDSETLLGDFTFADIAAAQALVFVEPPSKGLRLGRASRRAFAHPALKERYADLVAWRDRLYDAWRGAGRS